MRAFDDAFTAPVNGFADAADFYARCSSKPLLGASARPTLLLAATDDPLIPVANARLLDRLIPKSRLELIDNGHLFVVTRPKETAEMVEAFLQE